MGEEGEGKNSETRDDNMRKRMGKELVRGARGRQRKTKGGADGDEDRGRRQSPPTSLSVLLALACVKCKAAG